MELVLATQSIGKIREIKLLLAGLPIHITDLKERGITEQDPENGTTLEANSEAKALNAYRKTGCWSLADDAGIFFPALPDKAGVQSKEWIDHLGGPEEFAPFLREEFNGVDDLTATLRAVVTIIVPDGEDGIIRQFSGEVAGRLTLEPQGDYIPNLWLSSHFIPDGQTRSLAEMGVEELQRFSHRGRALAHAREFFEIIRS